MFEGNWQRLKGFYRKDVRRTTAGAKGFPHKMDVRKTTAGDEGFQYRMDSRKAFTGGGFIFKTDAPRDFPYRVDAFKGFHTGWIIERSPHRADA